MQNLILALILLYYQCIADVLIFEKSIMQIAYFQFNIDIGIGSNYVLYV